MPEVQNIGAVDYSMPIQQNQYANDFSSEENMPMVYDPEMEAKKSAASNHLGLTLLGTAIAAGLGIWGGYALGSRNKGVIDGTNQAMKDALKDINGEAKKFAESNIFKKGYGGEKFAESIQQKAKPFIEEAEKIAEDAAKDGETIAEDAAKIVENSTK